MSNQASRIPSSYCKANLRDRMPRIQGTGPNDKREKMTGKLKGRCSGGAFVGRRAS